MTCPYCRTENEPGAIRCRHCTSWIEASPRRSEWYRAREGRMIAGVCRGLSDRFGVPVAALRLILLLSILLGGWGIILYVALWIAMPIVPAPAAPARDPIVTPPPPPAKLEPGTQG
ncbi:MAG TPA: PspC domain-containing protein [Anaeromyxobacteraceae bacterium]|nr:PspC domain-containing protein [Anaeromyxobacteraceae bacterium]